MIRDRRLGIGRIVVECSRSDQSVGVIEPAHAGDEHLRGAVCDARHAESVGDRRQMMCGIVGVGRRIAERVGDAHLIAKAIIRVLDGPWRRDIPVRDRRDSPVGVVGQREIAAAGVRDHRQQRARIRKGQRVSVRIPDLLQEAGRSVEKEFDPVFIDQLQRRSDLLQGSDDSCVDRRVGAALIDEQVVAAVAPLDDDVRAGEEAFDAVIESPAEAEGSGETALVGVVCQFNWFWCK